MGAPQSRKSIIAHAIADLQRLRADPSFGNQYAVEENISFFKATVHPFSYFRWLVRRAPQLDGRKLLELADLPLPYWEREMHVCLLAIEKQRFPGLIAPLVNGIVEFIARENRPLLIANFGCGGMEIERQVVQKLVRRAYRYPVAFVGIDRSSVTPELAQENLRSLGSILEFREVDVLDTSFLERLRSSTRRQYLVVLCKHDVLGLGKNFAPRTFDLVFHSLFKHHLSEQQQSEFDSVVAHISRRSLEYDGYRSWFVMIPQTLTVWRYPILLNATIFSDLRYSTKEILRERYRGEELSFFRIGTYLLERTISSYA